MVNKLSPGDSVPKDTAADAKLQAALAQLKAATDRHEAMISVLSRVGVSAQDKRSAQAENRKIDHALREARRLVREAKALGGQR
jgi:hypothetical protein